MGKEYFDSGNVFAALYFDFLPELVVEYKEKFSYQWKKDLWLGCKGVDVKMLQKALKQLGFFRYDILTEYFGSITKEAVKEFQCKHKIVCEGNEQTTGWGRLGPQTRKTLNEIFK